MLKRACIKSLRLAQNYESISFPAISSEFPLDICANTMIHAFYTWNDEFPHAALKDIYVVVNDHAVQAFSDAMWKHLTVFAQPHHNPITTIAIPTPTIPFPSSKKKKKHKRSPVVMDDITANVPTTKTTPIASRSGMPAPISMCKGELLKQKVKYIYVCMYVSVCYT